MVNLPDFIVVVTYNVLFINSLVSLQTTRKKKVMKTIDCTHMIILHIKGHFAINNELNLTKLFSKFSVSIKLSYLKFSICCVVSACRLILLCPHLSSASLSHHLKRALNLLPSHAHSCRPRLNPHTDMTVCWERLYEKDGIVCMCSNMFPPCQQTAPSSICVSKGYM